MIENQKPFNFDSSAPKLKISTTVITTDTSPTEKLEIKHENNQYKIKYEAELQLHLKQKSHYCTNLGKAYAFLFGQCTKGLQHRIEAKTEYKSKIKGDPINCWKQSRKIPCHLMTRRRPIKLLSMP